MVSTCYLQTTSNKYHEEVPHSPYTAGTWHRSPVALGSGTPLLPALLCLHISTRANTSILMSNNVLQYKLNHFYMELRTETIPYTCMIQHCTTQWMKWGHMYSVYTTVTQWAHTPVVSFPTSYMLIQGHEDPQKIIYSFLIFL